MDIVEEIKNSRKQTLALGKAFESLESFAEKTNSFSMFGNYGGNHWGVPISPLIPKATMFQMIFKNIVDIDGLILFCLNSMDLEIALNGFERYEDAADNFYITEWELSIILGNPDYLERTVFHNNKVKFIFDKEKRTFTWKRQMI